jgi:GTP-binding protein HflX
MSPTSWSSRPLRERAILAGRETRPRRGEDGEFLTELRLLAETAGAQVRGEVIQRRGSVRAATFLSKGKIDEVRTLSGEEQATLLLLDDDLSPAQSRNLGEQLNMKVVDRTGLILDIFSRRARTREARIQVELAQLQYLLPRLTRMWEHLSRLGGGIGTRGPGETQLEVDRRRIRERISKLKRELEGVVKERRVQRQGRRGSYKISLVGYTNAGKSTLFNVLTRSSVYVEDQPFATLDPTTRIFSVERGARALLTDTVGFIRKLPPHLVASFRATLEEVAEADLLLHIVDATEPDIEAHIEAVENVLESIGALQRPRLSVFNKIDSVTDEVSMLGLRARYPGAVFASALTKEGLPELRQAVMRHLLESGNGQPRMPPLEP